jgi:hypothetical protein
MVRRTIALALAGLALAATPALAGTHWNSQMKDATRTASRSAGGCGIHPGSRRGSLLVTCGGGHTARLVYTFSLGHHHNRVHGTPTCGVSGSLGAQVRRHVKVSGGSLTVTVTVTHGKARLDTISVGYYTR